MRISDWSSDVCSSDLRARGLREDIELVLVARVMLGRITDRIPQLECQRAGADAPALGGYTYVGVAAAKHLVVPPHPDAGQVTANADLQPRPYAPAVAYRALGRALYATAGCVSRAEDG